MVGIAWVVGSLAARAQQVPEPAAGAEPAAEAPIEVEAPAEPVPDADGTAAAADAREKAAVLELTGMGRRSYDLEVFVRYDGNLYFQDEMVEADDLESLLKERIAAAPDARVVITGDQLAPYEALVKVMVLARAVGATRTALEVLGPDLSLPDDEIDDPLFTNGGGEIVALDGTAPGEDLADLEPKRSRFPQNPYGNNASFTAYALEWGESKIGFGTIATGIAPRFQLGTAPALDVIGVFNANLKANLLRKGPFDGAVGLQYYHVPVTALAGLVGADMLFNGSGGDTVAVEASYLGVGVTGSLQVVDPWSIHLQAYWARPAIKGNISFDDLPEVILPGLSIGDSAAVGLGAIGDLGIVNLATDLRFNRRDSVYGWLRYPFYGRVRGKTNGEVEGFDQLSNASVIVAYGDWIPLRDSYSFAIGYQASWKHFEGRVGIGWSAVPAAWLLQAFELSYKFGGATRRQERQIRRGYRRMPESDATGDAGAILDGYGDDLARTDLTEVPSDE